MKYLIVFPLDSHYEPRSFESKEARDEAMSKLSVSDWRKAHKRDGDGPIYS
jgi:hypothetical protein